MQQAVSGDRPHSGNLPGPADTEMEPSMTLRQHRSMRSGVAALCAVAASFLCSAEAQIASPLLSTPTDRIEQGEFLFADLLTSDVGQAARFYEATFGWVRRRTDDPGYIELFHDGEPIGAILAYDDEVSPGSSRWLPSVSVADVDAQADLVASMGGEILEAPTDVPDRGRLAIVSDAEGAVFTLLRSSSGDPERPDRSLGRFGWAELWSRDVAKAVSFYERAFGYRALRSTAAGATPAVVLTTKEVPRATIVAAPFDDLQPNWLPYVPVADARALLDVVAEHGGSVLMTSDEVDGDSGSFAAIIADPTGGVLAIQTAGESQ
jgi:predicted enzyme related to lactoylglutathione lyase